MKFAAGFSAEDRRALCEDGMTRRHGQLAIAMMTALALSGCAWLRNNQTDTTPVAKKDPFKDDDQAKSYKAPDILKTSSIGQFPPPDFPTSRFKDSQETPLAAVEPLPLPKVDARPAKLTPSEIVVKHEPLAEALNCFLDNKHDEALRHLQAYDAETQDLFLRLLPAMSILSKKKLTELSAAEVAVLHEQLYSLASTLRTRTPLTIDKCCFCEWVKGYGDYKPLPEGHAFGAATANRVGDLVQLYVELRNFANEPRQGWYVTRFSSSVEICDSRGELAWSNRFDDETKPIRSRTQLHDWYNNYLFHIPKNLPPGTYRLTIQVADETIPESRRVARQTLELRVAPPTFRVAMQ
jgi:hypothetical protein